jgi:hypothetical protein
MMARAALWNPSIFRDFKVYLHILHQSDVAFDAHVPCRVCVYVCTDVI